MYGTCTNEYNMNDEPLGAPWGQSGDGDGLEYRAALLSGPPGVGKTTTAKLCCESIGLPTIEMNASDARSKKVLDTQLKETLQCGYIQEGEIKTVQKHCIIMDEVDGTFNFHVLSFFCGFNLMYKHAVRVHVL